jgi:RNA polymerase sigma factor (sigma-70 family)
MELLQDYATRQSERAFEELVRRHINFVYSSALRQVGNAHLAEEVTQATFTILAQKAATLKPNTVVASWLFNTVRFVAAAEFRRAARRKKHEQEAVMESWTQENNPDSDWQQVGPLLDECLVQLSEKDRQVVLLRFLEQKSFMEVGAVLGTNADTATKRAKRAVEKLRQLFIKRGVVLSVAAIATVLSAHGVQAAPAGLAGPVVATALIHGATATTPTTTLIKGALKLMAWTKIKTTIVAVGVVLAFGAATVTVTEIHNHGSGGRIRYFSDGSFIRLLSSSYGTYFSYKSPGVKPWQSSLARRLPSGIASQFDWWMGNNGSVSMSSPSGVTNLAVIIAGERPSQSLPPQVLMVVDQQGDQSLAAFSGSSVGYDDGKHFKTIQMWELSAFPRRAKTLGLRFIRISLNTNSKPTMAEFQIPNPAFRNYPVWTPEPLPTTQTDGDLSVTLVGEWH